VVAVEVDGADEFRPAFFDGSFPIEVQFVIATPRGKKTRSTNRQVSSSVSKKPKKQSRCRTTNDLAVC
jgi:hypothetical protein